MGDIIVISVLVLVCGTIVFSMVKNKKKGGCSCGCASCAKRDLCHPNKNDEK